MNAKSFSLNRTKVVVPFIKLAGTIKGLNGDVIHKYNARFEQPSKKHTDMPELHSLGHLVAENIRNHDDKVVDLSSMGCQTGFYVSFINHDNYDDVLNIVEATLNDTLNVTEVSACNEVQCGRATNHSLKGAKVIAQAFLGKQDEWRNVFGTGK